MAEASCSSPVNSAVERSPSRTLACSLIRSKQNAAFCRQKEQDRHDMYKFAFKYAGTRQRWHRSENQKRYRVAALSGTDSSHVDGIRALALSPRSLAQPATILVSPAVASRRLRRQQQRRP
eukprot:2267643-Pleurochrysis_carterae.AAC.1